MKIIPATVLVMILGAGLARPQGSPQLTLPAALKLADEQNLDLIAARMRRAVSTAGIQIARQRPNPTFSVSASRDDPHEGTSFDQPIELGGKRGRRIDVARQEGALTDAEIAALERQIRRITRDAYYNLAFANADTARLGTVVALAERLKQIAEERFNAGAVPELEVIQADLELARAQADFQVAGQRKRVALSQLNALLNVSPSTSWEIASALESIPENPPLQELIQRAYEANPDLQHLGQEERVEESRRNLLKAERIPDVTLGFGVDFNAPHNFDAGPRGQISLMIPLFSRNQGEIAQSLASQHVLESQAAATRRSVAGQVESGFLDLDSRQTEVELYKQRLLPATRRLESLAEESYRAGKSGILTVLDAQRNAQEVERQYLLSLLDLHTAYAALEEAVGAPLK
jgi:outer membrane protein, heavy metal efflux system